jgi:hypothetical protein
MQLSLGKLTGLLVACATAVQAQIPACTPRQLRGDEGQFFTITGGNGTYAPNSTQAIVWKRPIGAPVRAIRPNVTIVEPSSGAAYPGENVTGVPVIFTERETEQTGGIGLTIPSDVPVGNGYVFRVTIRSRRALCYLDTAPFNLTLDAPNPQQNCNPGNMRCTEDLFGFQQCIETDETHSLFDFGPIIDCAFSTHCNQVTNFTISCTNTTISGECNLGDRECVTLTSNRECVLNDHGIPSWGPETECPVGTVCTDGICGSGTGGNSTTTAATTTTDTSTTGTSTATATSSSTPSPCIPRSQICLSDVEYDECIQNENGVWNLGGVTLTCPEGSVCTEYIDNTINCVPTVDDGIVSILAPEPTEDSSFPARRSFRWGRL